MNPARHLRLRYGAGYNSIGQPAGLRHISIRCATIMGYLHGVGPLQNPPKSLDFYCRDCDATFVSRPDGTGYDQAACPTCERLCLTVEFELEEQERHRTEAAAAGLFGGLFSALFGENAGLFGRLGPRGPGDEYWQKEASDQSTDATQLTDPVTIATFTDPADVERCRNLLTQEGIVARAVDFTDSSCLVPRVSVSQALQVEAGDAARASRLIEHCETSPQDVEVDDVEDAVFPCEECGKTLTLPGERRGYVEICSHCGQYVDVPE
jgi:hypothetical protein